ncbi:MAG: hypothetical protein R2750_07445 [Bacteroidales bacterium]
MNNINGHNSSRNSTTHTICVGYATAKPVAILGINADFIPFDLLHHQYTLGTTIAGIEKFLAFVYCIFHSDS